MTINNKYENQSNSIKFNDENQWKSIENYERQYKSKKINEHPWTSENPWKLRNN
jgi:hypothetical protein